MTEVIAEDAAGILPLPADAARLAPLPEVELLGTAVRSHRRLRPPTRLAGLRVAIVHDYLTQRGGAERVVLAMHRMFPDAPIHTALYDPDQTYPEFAAADVRPSALQRLPRRPGAHRGLLPAYPAVFGGLTLQGYDLVISSSSGFAHGVRAPGASHVCYCYTPPRWLYRTSTYVVPGGAVPAWARPALPPVLAALRRWDRRAAARPDAYVAVSAVVADRIREVYGRDAEVVHPPVEVDRLAALLDEPPGALRPEEGDPPRYVVVARLLPYKRIELAIRACRTRGASLVVVGDGPERARLDREAAGEVDFRSGLSDAELAQLIAAATAVIQPGEEDLGLVPVEANALGVPAVAFAASGALETVVDGMSGVLFREQTAESLGAALDAVERRAWDPVVLRAQAGRFDESRFGRRLEDRIAAVLGLDSPSPGLTAADGFPWVLEDDPA